MKTKFLLFFILIFSISSLINGQESEEPLIVSVPVSAMQEVVRRILIYNFKPRNKKTNIFLRKKGIKQDWLPKIENIEFLLRTEEEIEDRGLKVYFFKKLEPSNRTDEIGFAYGDPNCGYEGTIWRFRASKNRVRLWLANKGFGGGCGSSNGSFGEFEKPGKLNEFPNELKGYKFFDSGKLKGLKLTISSKEDVKNNLGADCAYSCDYNDKWKVRFRYFGGYSTEKTIGGKRIKFVAKPELINKLYQITLIPKSTLLFDKVVFPKPFRRSNGFSASHDGKGGGTNRSYHTYEDKYGLKYEILNRIGYTTEKDLKWQKGELMNIRYTIPEKLKETMFIEDN